MKKETKYVRRDRRILNNETGEVKQYESINAAKRASRKLQGDDLGSGLVVKDSK